MSPHIPHTRARRGAHELSNPARSSAKPVGRALARARSPSPRRREGRGGAGRGRRGQVAAAGGGSAAAPWAGPSGAFPQPGPAPAPRRAAPPRFAMVERGDAAPLLRWAEGPAVSPPQAPDLPAAGRAWGGGGGGRAAAEPRRRREPAELGASEVLLQPGRLELGDVEEDQVVAVFVVTFDPRSGESRSGAGGGERVAPPPPATPGWGAVGEGLAARSPTHLHPPPGRPGSRGASRVPPRGLGAGLGALFPAPSGPPLLSVSV